MDYYFIGVFSAILPVFIFCTAVCCTMHNDKKKSNDSIAARDNNTNAARDNDTRNMYEELVDNKIDLNSNSNAINNINIINAGDTEDIV